MKLLLFTLLMILSFSSIALEFYRCIDDKNQVHFTNLPIASLDINCLPKDRYTMMLNQDYRNLASEFEKYGASVDETRGYESRESNQPANAITPSVKGILDSEAVERVLEQDILKTPAMAE